MAWRRCSWRRCPSHGLLRHAKGIKMSSGEESRKPEWRVPQRVLGKGIPPRRRRVDPGRTPAERGTTPAPAGAGRGGVHGDGKKRGGRRTGNPRQGSGGKGNHPALAGAPAERRSTWRWWGRAWWCAAATGRSEQCGARYSAGMGGGRSHRSMRGAKAECHCDRSTGGGVDRVVELICSKTG
ncbi:Os01g0686050 [Oryza sativa Japonica Group]|uniref:Os01g0686050 protein n=2 Tax=Oryza sativa subsp. japonica TaxID=39947 RepID=A0A0P0V6P9_ORYSJ|nr:Os01g0686050 [Oryza sativa Japonica Group]